MASPASMARARGLRRSEELEGLVEIDTVRTRARLSALRQDRTT